MEHHIGGCVYGIKIQLGDGPMNLPIELQRRLDRRWSARFGVSDQGSRPALCAAMVSAESRSLERAKSPPPSTAMIKCMVVKAQAPALNFRAGHPALAESDPASYSTHQLEI
jgi:hypothetical protein